MNAAGISYEAFCSRIREATKNRDDISLESCAALSYRKEGNEKRYDLIKIRSKEINADDKILLIRASIHGDEVSGPLTLMNHLCEIFDCAHKNNVKLIVYPLGNPSGFDYGIRYNIENDNGEAGNNDFMRYELENGKVVYAIGEDDSFKKWHWATDPALGIKLPKETIAMIRELKKLPLKQIKGVIDLHQDLTPNAKPAAYHYSFGNMKIYDDIVKEIESIVPILRNTDINLGLRVQIDSSGEANLSEGEMMKTDPNGFIISYNCTLDDLLYRIGAKYSITAETTGSTPLDIAEKVNLIWIKGLVDLIKE